MSDMLVKLYDLPDYSGAVAGLRSAGVEIRRAIPPEKHLAVNWVMKTFNSPGWASECEKAFGNTPVACMLAVEKEAIVGFCCYDATCRGFLGPMGVNESCRNRGIGKALLWAALHAMWEIGYGYAVIGWAGPKDFYARTVGATVIEGSTPGIYRGMAKG